MGIAVKPDSVWVYIPTSFVGVLAVWALSAWFQHSTSKGTFEKSAEGAVGSAEPEDVKPEGNAVMVG
jgi:hypothetical protein